ELVAAFSQTRYDARTALVPRALEGGVGGAGRIGVGRVHDAMEVVTAVRQRVLRRLALKIAQLVHAAPLDRRLGPDEPDGAPQPGIAVDDGQDRCPQPTRDEIIEAAFPRRERLTAAELQPEQMFVPIG